LHGAIPKLVPREASTFSLCSAGGSEPTPPPANALQNENPLSPFAKRITLATTLSDIHAFRTLPYINNHNQSPITGHPSRQKQIQRRENGNSRTHQPPFFTPTLKIAPINPPPRTPFTYARDMAQGKLKGMKTAKQKATRPASSSSTTKKGKRYIAPKKTDAIKIASLKKVQIRLFFPPSPLPPTSFNLSVGRMTCSEAWPYRTSAQRSIVRSSNTPSTLPHLGSSRS